MTNRAIEHFLNDVLPAASDYDETENALSEAERDSDTARQEYAAKDVKRRASVLAVSIDVFADRIASDCGMEKGEVASAINALCVWPSTGTNCVGAFGRISGAAQAYKHSGPIKARWPLDSYDDILVFQFSFGMGGYGVGKFGGSSELTIKDRQGEHWKFLGDVPVAIAACLRFLNIQGVKLPDGPFIVCNLQIHPLPCFET